MPNTRKDTQNRHRSTHQATTSTPRKIEANKRFGPAWWSVIVYPHWLLGWGTPRTWHSDSSERSWEVTFSRFQRTVSCVP